VIEHPVFETQHSGRVIRTCAPDGTEDGTWQRLLTTPTYQLSLVVVNPLTLMGYYLHGERTEWHVCIKGQVLITQVARQAVPSSADRPVAVEVPALVPHGIYNASEEEAWVLVIADLPHKVDEDEWPLPVADFELEMLAEQWTKYYGD
jgi:hypothetical protein